MYYYDVCTTMMSKKSLISMLCAKKMYILLFVVFATSAFALPKADACMINPNNNDCSIVTMADSTVFTIVEEQPQFPGGLQALQKFIADSIRYPEEAKKAGIQGRAIVTFIVEKDGSLSNFKIIRSTKNDLLDKEAIRVIKSMPKWKPGKSSGSLVRVNFTLPVPFVIKK